MLCRARVQGAWSQWLQQEIKDWNGWSLALSEYPFMVLKFHHRTSSVWEDSCLMFRWAHNMQLGIYESVHQSCEKGQFESWEWLTNPFHVSNLAYYIGHLCGMPLPWPWEGWLPPIADMDHRDGARKETALPTSAKNQCMVKSMLEPQTYPLIPHPNFHCLSSVSFCPILTPSCP